MGAFGGGGLEVSENVIWGGGGRVGWITHLVPLLKVKYVCEGPGPGPDVKQHGFIHNESSETK
jgi:hypothetical protein